MKFKQLILILLAVSFGGQVWGQSRVVSKDKPLAFLNPAIQTHGYERGIVSLSYLSGSTSDEETFLNYLAMAEYKFGNFRIGAHGSSVNNKFNKQDMFKAYASFGYEFEPGNSVAFGLEAGYYQDQSKLAFFNRAFSPSHYSYTDSSIGQLDLGLGLAVHSQGLTIGLALNKLNQPSYVGYPVQQWRVDPSDSLSLIKKDTNIVLGSDENLQYTLQSVITIGYEWRVGDVAVQSLFNLYNLDLAGHDFADFQNIINIRDQWKVSLGLFSNGEWSYMGSVGYAFSPHFQMEVAAFLQEEFAYDPEAPYPVAFANGYLIKAKGASVSVGYRPSLEANIQIRF